MDDERDVTGRAVTLCAEHRNDVGSSISTYEMALTEHDRDWIRLTIDESLRTHSKRWVTRIREWSVPGLLVAILAVAFIEWRDYVVFRTHAEDRLEVIDAKLINLSPSSSARKTLSDLKNLKPTALAVALPALHRLSLTSPPPAIHDASADLQSISKNLVLLR